MIPHKEEYCDRYESSWAAVKVESRQLRFDWTNSSYGEEVKAYRVLWNTILEYRGDGRITLRCVVAK
jgi:hypothetical protein